MSLGLAAAVCAIAIFATPALAHEFISSGGPSTGKGEEQEFKFGAFKITCARASSKGGASTPTSSPTFFTEVKFSKCNTEAKIGGNPIFLHTKFVTPLAIEYHANGFVEIGSEGEEIAGPAKLKGGSVELKIKAIKCVITLPEQTIPSAAMKKPNGEFEAATFSNVAEERGKRKFNELAISNEFKGIHFEYGEGQCEEFKGSEEERKAGKYTGELLESIRGGNLEYQ
ncbi:MAG TPA: hypothetical protein VGI27_04095 [Solirubrobacteraceae bacterium]